MSRCGSARSGGVAPSSPNTCASAEPPRRFAPAPRSTSNSTVAPRSVRSCGVQVLRTSRDRRERGNDQRHGRDHRLARGALAPHCLHRQRILADRNRDAERRTKLFADGVHRGIQRGVFARLAAGRHPVGRQLHVRQRADVGRENVGERFADREAARGRRIEHRDRRAFAHRHRFAGVAEVVGDGHGDVGHRHLPRAHHLVAADHAADGAIADRNQEGLVGHRRETQQAIGGFAQVELVGRRTQPAAASRDARRAASSAPCLTTLRAADPPGACRAACLPAPARRCRRFRRSPRTDSARAARWR